MASENRRQFSYRQKHLFLLYPHVIVLHLIYLCMIILFSRRLRQQVQMKLLLHLCVAWFMALVFFIIGGRVTDHRGPCTTMAVLTHFFLLAVFAFSFAQAYYLYCSLVKIYGNLVKKFMWKCILLGWGEFDQIILFAHSFHRLPERRTCEQDGWHYVKLETLVT